MRNGINDRRLSTGVLAAFCAAFLFISFHGFSQQNVFQMFRDGASKGDQYFAEGSYRHALEVFMDDREGTGSTLQQLKIARCHYRLHEYSHSVAYFRKAAQSGVLIPSDQFMFAEALAAVGEYEASIREYQALLKENAKDELVQNKIWRLKNIHYLFEDSLHFSIRRLPVSSPGSDFAAVAFERGLVFVSDRKGASVFDESDGLTGQHPFRIYSAEALHDSQSKLFDGYGKVVPFKGLAAKYHNGPIVFFANETKAAFVRSAESRHGRKTLQLFFAHREGRTWKESGSFPHNSDAYNVTDPAINADGTVLYFSSDKKGGYGGMDLYKSEWKEGKWSMPVNLGSSINTRLDETSPHVFRDHLYFSSNGHAGMGGADIFRAPVHEGGFGELTNPGYPLNSSADDFGFSFRADGDGGYLSSNRSGNDEIYEIEIDLQTYPVLISGILKAKDFSLADSSGIHILPGARMYLIDHTREIIVDEVSTDQDGHFQFRIPYFSQYKIKVTESSGAESIVSLQIPRQKKADFNHEIVVVKDAFHTPRE